MPSPYITYALAALTFGLGVAFFRLSEENSELVQAKAAVEMEASALRDKYNSETKARQFAEAAQTIAETTERAVRSELAHEAKARQAAETAKQTAEAALVSAQEKLTALNAKLIEAGLAPAEPKTQAEATEPNARAYAAPAPAEASLVSSRRSFWSFFGF
jgi:hypothetical protein